MSGAHLNLLETGVYSDSIGDSAKSSLTGAIVLSHKIPVSYTHPYAIFNSVGHPCVNWSVHITFTGMSYNVSSSWHDSGASSGNAPTSGSCTGSTSDRRGIFGMNVDVRRAGSDPRVRTDFSFASGNNPGVKCSAGQPSSESDQVVGDSFSNDGGWGDDLHANVPLPLAALRGAAKNITLPIRVGYSHTVHHDYNGLSDVETFHLLWTGTVKLRRAYTCAPNGCLPPQH